MNNTILKASSAYPRRRKGKHQQNPIAVEGDEVFPLNKIFTLYNIYIYIFFFRLIFYFILFFWISQKFVCNIFPKKTLKLGKSKFQNFQTRRILVVEKIALCKYFPIR